jgi:hypothetical protein
MTGTFLFDLLMPWWPQLSRSSIATAGEGHCLDYTVTDCHASTDSSLQSALIF